MTPHPQSTLHDDLLVVEEIDAGSDDERKAGTGKMTLAVARELGYALHMSTAASENGDYFEWTDEHKLTPCSASEVEKVKDWLEKDYKEVGSMGVPDVHQLRWFACTGTPEKPKTAFIAVLTEGGKSKFIFVNSFDGLLRLRALIAPLITQSMIEVHLS